MYVLVDLPIAVIIQSVTGKFRFVDGLRQQIRSFRRSR
jgi:hypothetical protein